MHHRALATYKLVSTNSSGSGKTYTYQRWVGEQDRLTYLIPQGQVLPLLAGVVTTPASGEGS